MRCEGCGLEAQALKTVRWRRGKHRFVLCDRCYAPHSASLWIVPAPFVITSRCDSCGRYCSLGELDPATSRPGGYGKRDLVSTGLCRSCAGVE
jgi:hypothetical protein